MKRHLYILTLLILTFGCNNNTNDKIKNIDTLKVEEKKQTEAFSYNVYKSDSVTIDIRSDDVVFLVIADQKKKYDLKELKVLTRQSHPYSLIWVNSEYACIMTYWSLSDSRHIFIPINHKNEFLYLDKDIEESDSINNNIVYVDSFEDNVVFKVKNLLTRKSKSLEFSINEKNGVYPFYDKIVLTKNKLTMTTATEKKSIDIKEINNGL